MEFFLCRPVIPEINISSSPPSRTLFVREALNLTCIAWPRSEDVLHGSSIFSGMILRIAQLESNANIIIK